MPYTIAFVGIDGAGKTTLINKLKDKLGFPISHHNFYMKHLYFHQKSRTWEWLNLGEIILRNIWWRYYTKNHSLIMDRCYICGLVYSQLEGYSDIAFRIKKWAVHPDLICLMEPLEQNIPNADKFSNKYRAVLWQEGYEMVDFTDAYKGQITFWKHPEVISHALRQFIWTIGDHA